MTSYANQIRTARVVLCDASGALLGCLPDIELSMPWIQEVSELVAVIKERFDLSGDILRLLNVVSETEVRFIAVYLFETSDSVTSLSLSETEVTAASEPLRLAYAEPGGPRRLKQWAIEKLAAKSIVVHGPVTQIRTWNLSAIWRFETSAGRFWLKAIPPFFGHEAKVLEGFAGETVPRLFAADLNLVLTHDIPGEDFYGAPAAAYPKMVSRLVDLQCRYQDKVPELLALGVKDWRGDWFVSESRRVIALYGAELSSVDRDSLFELSHRLPETLKQLERCAFPETFIHGDFHPGNWRGESLDGELAILDWADIAVAHPMLEPHIPMTQYAELEQQEIVAHWRDCWRQVPDADFDQAYEISRPLVTLRIAVMFQQILEAIEPAEHVYHVADPPEFLRKTAELARARAQ